MKKNIFILLILTSVLLFGCSRNSFSQEQEKPVIKDITGSEQALDYEEEGAQAIKSTPKTKKVSLIIDFGSEKTKELEMEFGEGMSVFDLLQEGTGPAEIFLQTKMYNIGIFIEMIGDKKNGRDGKYWTYYVNGKFAPVAADKFKLKAGDKVEWKFEKLPL